MVQMAYCRRYETNTTQKVTFTIRKRFLKESNREALTNYIDRAVAEWLKLVVKNDK